MKWLMFCSDNFIIEVLGSVIKEVQQRKIGGLGFSACLDTDIRWLEKIKAHIATGGDPRSHPEERG